MSKQGIDCLYEFIDVNLKLVENSNDKKNSQKEYKKIVWLSKKLIEIAREEELIITKSPYGNSYYAIKPHEKIEWGYKPENSYRLSDHWNWVQFSNKNNSFDMHCKADILNSSEWCICKYLNKIYQKVY